jgi:hypothetical protein
MLRFDFPPLGSKMPDSLLSGSFALLLMGWASLWWMQVECTMSAANPDTLCMKRSEATKVWSSTKSMGATRNERMKHFHQIVRDKNMLASSGEGSPRTKQ